MTTLTQLCQTIQTVLTTVADRAARGTTFVQRQSKLSGAKFVQTVVFTWLGEAQATYEQMAQTAATLGLTISPQGLEERFSPEAAACLRQVLETAVHEAITADPVVIPLLQRFNGVYLLDSTTVRLPDALAPLWAGSGGSTTEGTQAALKAQVRLNLSTGQLTHLDLQPGRAQDKTAPMQTDPLPAGALRLADLGYFAVPVLAAHHAQCGYWLSRYHPHTRVFTADGQPLDWDAFLQTQVGDTVDQAIQLTQRHQLPCRLVAQRVPLPVAVERRRKLKAELRREGRTPTAKQLALAGWTLFVTNVPSTLLSLKDILVLGRVRWQIELLFKLWKSHGQIDTSRSDKPYRILCEVYAKLLALLIQHWILVISCWHYPNRSLFKAAKTIRQHAVALAETIGSTERLEHELAIIRRCLASGARLNTRKTAPNAYQLLLACSQEVLA